MSVIYSPVPSLCICGILLSSKMNAVYIYLLPNDDYKTNWWDCGRHNPFHDPSHVQVGFDMSLSNLGLDYGETNPRIHNIAVSRLTHNPYSRSLLDALYGYRPPASGLLLTGICEIVVPHAYVPLPETFDTLRKPDGKVNQRSSPPVL